MNGWQLAGIALASLAAVFLGLFFIAKRVENYGLVDIAWSYAFGALTVFYALVAHGWAPRRLAIATMASLWSIRLGTHLAIRVIGHHPTEDSRYRQLRQDWHNHFALKMAGFFQMQAVSVVVLGLAFLIITQNRTPEFHALEIGGMLLWLVALAGETVADRQLAAFKRTDAGLGGICNVGLWRFSRHPNYFFEWLIWVSYFVFAIASLGGWVSAIGPVGILWLLLRVTGIPMTEAQSIRKRGDAYRQYQRVTSSFVPLPPRRPSPTK
jgi:steroid 5-alpha reductase family enzyme